MIELKTSLFPVIIKHFMIELKTSLFENIFGALKKWGGAWTSSRLKPETKHLK